MPETDERRRAEKELAEVGENLPEGAVGRDDGDVRPEPEQKEPEAKGERGIEESAAKR